MELNTAYCNSVGPCINPPVTNYKKIPFPIDANIGGDVNLISDNTLVRNLTFKTCRSAAGTYDNMLQTPCANPPAPAGSMGWGGTYTIVPNSPFCPTC
jgi:hypothetical protein